MNFLVRKVRIVNVSDNNAYCESVYYDDDDVQWFNVRLKAD